MLVLHDMHASMPVANMLQLQLDGDFLTITILNASPARGTDYSSPSPQLNY